MFETLLLGAMMVAQPLPGPIDSLEREWVRLRRVNDSMMARLRPLQPGYDTVTAQQVTLLLDSVTVDPALAAGVGANWQTLVAGSRLGAWLTIQRAEDFTWGWGFPGQPGLKVIAKATPGGEITAVANVPGRISAATTKGPGFERALWEGLGSVLFATADSSLKRWLASPPQVNRSHLERDDIRYQMATVRLPNARRCFDGELATCAAALGVVGQAPVEIPPGLRHALLATVLDRGGQGAWTRLLANPSASIQTRLESAGAGRFDELVAGWLAESRDVPSDGSDGKRVVVSLLWIAVALGLGCGLAGRV